MQVTRAKQEPQRTKSILSTNCHALLCKKKKGKNNKTNRKQSAQCPRIVAISSLVERLFSHCVVS